jgi:hypothetical protein
VTAGCPSTAPVTTSGYCDRIDPTAHESIASVHRAIRGNSLLGAAGTTLATWIGVISTIESSSELPPPSSQRPTLPMPRRKRRPPSRDVTVRATVVRETAEFVAIGFVIGAVLATLVCDLVFHIVR